MNYQHETHATDKVLLMSVFRKLLHSQIKSPWRNIPLTTWFLIFLGTVLLTIWAAQADRFPGDVAVGRWIQANDIPGRELSQFLRDVGSTIAALVTIILIATLFIIQSRCRMARVVLILVFALALQALLKEIVDRPRTSILFLEQYGTFDSPSFPSGHTMSSTLAGSVVIYTALRSGGSPLLRAPFVLWGLGVALLQPWASVSAGVHWPSDVLGGFLWSILIIIPTFFLIERWALPRDRAQPLPRRAVLPVHFIR
jgi:undecaprenyl-diphosphatase